VVDHPRARIHIEDGRVFLATRDTRYDVITVDPIHPYVAGASALYTRDYFAQVKRRLRPGGVVSHWLPLYQLGPAEVLGVLRSFADVFEDATVYNTGQDAILIGGAGPDLPGSERVLAGFGLAGVREDLARVLIDSPEQLVALATLPNSAVRELTARAAPITDDHTWIEFTAPRYFQAPTLSNVTVLSRLRPPKRDGAGAAERLARDSYAVVLRATVMSPGADLVALLEGAVARDPDSRELRLRLENSRGLRRDSGAGM
jgi:spermidine synthase